MGTPTFVIIGAQKAGTTSLHAYLACHPSVSMSAPKEVHYFDRDGDYPDHAWYRGQFQPHVGTRAIGEATPIYCFWPGAIQRLHAFDPTLKLIMSLRNPIDRAVSQYWMEFQRQDEHLALPAAFAAEASRLADGAPTQALRSWSYLARGRYAEQLDRIYQFFPPQQVLTLRFEELVREPKAVLRHVTDFLGVEPASDIPFERAFGGRYPPLDPALRERLRTYFAPCNADLTARYGIPTNDWT